MDNKEVADDQNSGWFEVKKKNRNTSKFSLQSWVGGFSGKNASNSLRTQNSMVKNDGNLHGKLRPHLSRAGENFVQSPVNVSNSISDSNEEEGTCDLNTSVVKHDNQSQKSPSLLTEDSQDALEDVEKIPQNNKPDIVHKIKWGDLEDESLSMPQDNSSGAGIKFGTIGDDNLPCNSFHAQDNDLVAETVDRDFASNQTPSLVNKDEISGENGVEIKDLSLEEIPAMKGEEINQEDDILNCKKNDSDIKTMNGGCLSNEIKIFEVPQTNCNSGSAVTAESMPHVPKNGLEIVGDSAASVEDVRGTQDVNVDGVMSSSHNMSALEEGDSNESKERFRQRLWCFLFENLNRSVDELYLLCELECDLEQMKEAILVLEEAASDFKELINRVEEFEKVKKSSQVIDGVPVILRSDHRRTHALSWEVRLVVLVCCLLLLRSEG